MLIILGVYTLGSSTGGTGFCTHPVRMSVPAKRHINVNFILSLLHVVVRVAQVFGVTYIVLLLDESVIVSHWRLLTGVKSYPILTISARVSVSVFSRSLERSYPLKASSRNRVSSAVDLSELPKMRLPTHPTRRPHLVQPTHTSLRTLDYQKASS